MGVNVWNLFDWIMLSAKSNSFVVCPLDGNKRSHQDNRIILDTPAGRQTGPRQLFPFKTDSKPLSRRLYFYLHGKGIWGVQSCKISNKLLAFPQILPKSLTFQKMYIHWYKNIERLRKEYFHCISFFFFFSFPKDLGPGKSREDDKCGRNDISAFVSSPAVSYRCQLEMCQPKWNCVYQMTTFLCGICFPIVSLSFYQSDASLFKCLNFDKKDEFRKDNCFWKYNLLEMVFFQYISLIDTVYLFFFISCAK